VNNDSILVEIPFSGRSIDPILLFRTEKPLPMSHSEKNDIFDQLFSVLCDRQKNPSEKSYTASLFAGGEEKICRKITEESGELVEAAFESGDGADDHLIHETADLLFHAMVLLVQKGLSLDDVREELARRFGISGLEEKSSRSHS
jgi:phosphoribosyl-ATP pyrophosphohydrolase